ncbi:MAG: ThiF family adenylyltransferase, partial [Candidatus Subteraquimicrobiales bacterium]|nr:ThiF family adenylyltransferase [Candidatus Subteraquimicrobiales bacterium]
MSINMATNEIDVKQHKISSAGKSIRVTEYKKLLNANPFIKTSLEQRFRYSLEDVSGKQILVVGAGTLGNELIKNLILSGVTDITIVDNDSYVIENLPR